MAASDRGRAACLLARGSKCDCACNEAEHGGALGSDGVRIQPPAVAVAFDALVAAEARQERVKSEGVALLRKVAAAEVKGARAALRRALQSLPEGSAHRAPSDLDRKIARLHRPHKEDREQAEVEGRVFEVPVITVMGPDPNFPRRRKAVVFHAQCPLCLKGVDPTRAKQAAAFAAFVLRALRTAGWTETSPGVFYRSVYVMRVKHTPETGSFRWDLAGAEDAFIFGMTGVDDMPRFRGRYDGRERRHFMSALQQIAAAAELFDAVSAVLLAAGWKQTRVYTFEEPGELGRSCQLNPSAAGCVALSSYGARYMVFASAPGSLADKVRRLEAWLREDGARIGHVRAMVAALGRYLIARGWAVAPHLTWRSGDLALTLSLPFDRPDAADVLLESEDSATAVALSIPPAEGWIESLAKDIAALEVQIAAEQTRGRLLTEVQALVAARGYTEVSAAPEAVAWTGPGGLLTLYLSARPRLTLSGAAIRLRDLRQQGRGSPLDEVRLASVLRDLGATLDAAAAARHRLRAHVEGHAECHPQSVEAAKAGSTHAAVLAALDRVDHEAARHVAGPVSPSEAHATLLTGNAAAYTDEDALRRLTAYLERDNGIGHALVADLGAAHDVDPRSGELLTAALAKRIEAGLAEAARTGAPLSPEVARLRAVAGKRSSGVRRALADYTNRLIDTWQAYPWQMLEQGTSDQSFESADEPNPPLIRTFLAAEAEFGLRGAEGMPERLAENYLTSHEQRTDDTVRRLVLREMHRVTQRDLRAAGLTHVSLYRGMVIDTPPPALKSLYPGETMSLHVPMLGLSSWTSDHATAWTYATEAGGRPGSVAVVLRATFPVERVLSTARSGLGLLPSREVVVMTRPDDRDQFLVSLAVPLTERVPQIDIGAQR